MRRDPPVGLSNKKKRYGLKNGLDPESLVFRVRLLPCTAVNTETLTPSFCRSRSRSRNMTQRKGTPKNLKEPA
ncbi:hypothetical protein GBA52_025877 [Prunus armeniaca]|nr:hypothetical protein GBA52_025877 [Prunus armeniaca]